MKAASAILRFGGKLFAKRPSAARGNALTPESAPRRREKRRERQAAAIPYRLRYGTLQVLLVTTRSDGRGVKWIVPKGQVDPGMTESEAAANEAMEEAGVVGRVGQSAAGSFRIRKNGGPRDVAVFDLMVKRELDDWPERGQRKRRWLEVDEAAERVANRRLGKLIRRLPERLESRAKADRPAD